MKKELEHELRSLLAALVGNADGPIMIDESEVF